MSSHFRRQKRLCGKSSHAYSFEDKKKSDKKVVKSGGLQDYFQGFFDFFHILTPKIQKCFLKYQYFSKFRKNGIYVVVLIVCYLHAKFELGNSIFDKGMAKNYSKFMTSKI